MIQKRKKHSNFTKCNQYTLRTPKNNSRLKKKRKKIRVLKQKLKKKKTRAYTRLARDSAMPHHQIDRTIGQSLWLRDKTLDLKTKTKTKKLKKLKKKIRNAKLQK
jgi:hypothetical protein